MDAYDFLSVLFEHKPDTAHLLIWTLPERRSFWTASIDEATEYAMHQARSSDVYFGVGLATQPYAEDQRLKQGIREAAGIYGLWADIDIAGGEHTGKAYPPTLDDAHRLIEDMGIKPTLIIHTGGGLHCHYVFKEPWMFDTPEERSEARVLSWRWKETLKQRAGFRGWQVDSVPDLERVLRIPGTFNHKYAGPWRVQVR